MSDVSLTPPAPAPSSAAPVDPSGSAIVPQGKAFSGAGGGKKWGAPVPAPIPASWALPYSLEAERSVLGSLLIDPEHTFEAAREKLFPDSFFDPRNRAIFEALIYLRDKPMPIDPMMLRQRLEDLQMLGAVGGDAYIASLVSETPNPANIFSYTEIVKNKHLFRRVMHSCAEVVQRIQESPDDPSPVLDEAQQAFFRISSDTELTEAQSAGELVMPVLQLIDRMAKNKGKPSGVPTGFHDFDALTGGLRAGDLLVVAARPGVGKTSFALNIAEHAAVHLPKEERKGVAFFSLEMPSEQLLLRLLASRARVDLKMIRDGFLSQAQNAQIVNTAAEFMDAPLYIDNQPGMSLAQFRTKARRLKKNKNIDMIIVDYLQLITTAGGKKYDSRQAEVADISGGMKRTALELGIPIIVLCQLNRKPEERGGQPRLADLRESGSIEQDADMVAMLYRPDMYKDDKEDGPSPTSLIGDAILDLQKHRNGATEKIELVFLKNLTRFESRRSHPREGGEE